MRRLIDEVTHYDASVFFWCFHFSQSRWITSVSRTVSKTGDGYLHLAIPLFLILYGATATETFVHALLVGLAIERTLYFILKNSIRRDRPCHTLYALNAHVVPSDKFSFPSGHTSAAFLLACLLSGYFPDTTVFAYSWAAAVGMSRVVLGVHYPTDIAAGSLLGSSIGLACFNLI